MPNLSDNDIATLLRSAGLDDRPPLVTSVFSDMLRPLEPADAAKAIRELVQTCKYPTPPDLAKILGTGDDVESAWARVQPRLASGNLGSTDGMRELDGHAVRMCRWELQRAPIGKDYFIFKNAYAAAVESARVAKRRDRNAIKRREQAELGTARQELGA